MSEWTTDLDSVINDPSVDIIFDASMTSLRAATRWLVDEMESIEALAAPRRVPAIDTVPTPLIAIDRDMQAYVTIRTDAAPTLCARRRSAGHRDDSDRDVGAARSLR